MVIAVAVVVVVFFDVAALPQAARDKDAAAMSAIRNARNFLFFICGSFLGGGFRSNLPRGISITFLYPSRHWLFFTKQRYDPGAL